MLSAPVAPTLFRASAPPNIMLPQLGPLADLPGTWMGNGFNLISLPDKQDDKLFRLMLNATRETTTFTPIGAPIPDRGSAQDDIFYLGLHYLQEVNDAVTNGALHLEPGLWLNVPPTTEPSQPATVVRQSSVPHGDSLLAQGTASSTPGGPLIGPASTRPFGSTLPPGYLEPFRTAILPPGIPPGSIEDPNLVLLQAIQGQHIVNTVTLEVSTTPVGGIINIPFVVTNANATKLTATFWIETVQLPNGTEFLQLQYTQTVILRFLDVDWPHVSVATLVKR